MVLDIFAGSNTTGSVAERLERKWLAFEQERKYLAASVFRFLSEKQEETIKPIYEEISKKNIDQIQLRGTSQLQLFETKAKYKARAKSHEEIGTRKGSKSLVAK